jgi:hypothetical protein
VPPVRYRAITARSLRLFRTQRVTPTWMPLNAIDRH